MIEKVILANLLYNNSFCREVFPYIKENYFQDISEQKLFNSFSEYVEKYKEPPSKEALSISVSNRTDMNESAYKQVTDLIDSLKIDENTNIDWLKSETEKFCQDRDLFNAIRRSITILDGNDKELDKGSIPKLLSDSLSINFDTVIGHDYFEEYADRYAYYHHKESRIPFDLKILNLITKGGLPKKSLTLFLGETGSGKSLVKCHIASAALLAGLNVLYISMELSSEEIGRRIDANILNVNLDQVGTMDEDVYEKRVNRYKDKTPGKLIIKDYPTGAASAAHFRHLINELKLKKNFKPDIICIDYLNICSSSRVKGAGANQYAVIKSIAEEIRGLAMETDTAIISSSQLNRSGYGNGDPDLTNTSECILKSEMVKLVNGSKIEIGNLKPGDRIHTQDGSKIVTMVHHPKVKKCVKITTKSGKHITCSEEHVFPSKTATLVRRLSVSTGLQVGHKLNSVEG